jgi:hypothetical protein
MALTPAHPRERADTHYGAMSAAEAAFGEPQPPPIPLEPPTPPVPEQRDGEDDGQPDILVPAS